MCKCIACKKNEATKTKKEGKFTYCATCYKQIRRKGYAKAAVETSDVMTELAMKATKESAINIYEAGTMKDMMQPVVTVKTTKIGNNVATVTESDPMSFFNKKTQDYNMMNGDKEMMKRVSGFRISDIVEEKYQLKAYKLSEAINENNEIVCNLGIAVGESLNGMPPAIDSQIAAMLGYEKPNHRYNACMKRLIEAGVVFKFESQNCMINQKEVIYYFNPVLQCAGKGVSPRLFFLFFSSFQLMAQKNNDFKYRFQQMARYAFKWMMDKREDFKQLQADFNMGKITSVEAANGATEIFSKIADSYNVPVRLETVLDVDTEAMSAYEATMAKSKSTVTYSNVNKLTQEVEEETTEDELNALDASIAKTEQKITLVTDIKTKKTITTIDGREVGIPPAPLKKLPKVTTIKSLISSSATAAEVNNYVFEEDDIYDFVNKLNNKYKEIV